MNIGVKLEQAWREGRCKVDDAFSRWEDPHSLKDERQWRMGCGEGSEFW